MNRAELKKKRDLKPHRTKCCGNCRFAQYGNNYGVSCIVHDAMVQGDEVCSKHKYSLLGKY